MVKRDALDYEQYTFLGGRISSKKGLELFQKISKLGYEEAEQYVMIVFLEWLLEHPKASLEETLKTAVELIGMSHFLPLTSELTKLSMILGDTKKTRKWHE